MLLYIAHAATDRQLAAFLKSELERTVQDLRVFVASKPGDIPTGSDWLNEIHSNLRAADGFLFLLTPSSIERFWVWYEAGAAWMAGKPRLPVVAAGLDRGKVSYPLGASQILQLDDVEHAQQLFRDLGAGLEDPEGFVHRVRELSELVRAKAEALEGWEGLTHQGRYFAWRGPVHSLEDRQPVVVPPGLLTSLKQVRMIPTWGAERQLSHHLEKGRLQVFETDKNRWKRPVVQAPDAETLLLVHRAEDQDAETLASLMGELEFNATVAERAGSDELGTEFVTQTYEKALDDGVVARLDQDAQRLLTDAYATMRRANMHIRASAQKQRGSNNWANSVNAASKAIREAGEKISVALHSLSALI